MMVTWTHRVEFWRFLSSLNHKEAPNTRVSARQKNGKLPENLFQELLTDVYDEVVRIESNSE
ncbi:hypothetical protein FRC17_004305, partial [Serendipita sp. 399]